MLLLANRLPAFQSTGVTGLITAVRGFFALYRPLILSLQEIGGHPDINMSPGQKFIQRTLSVGIKARLKSSLGKSVQPMGIVEVLIPGIKG